MEKVDLGETAHENATSIVAYETAKGSMAWRATEPDAPGLFAIIADEAGTAIPLAPETDDMIIAIFDEDLPETLGSIEIDGRAGLNRWYLQQVGHIPDKESAEPVPIMELIQNVASHLMLRYYEPDHNDV
jgi:hypothetical protein